MKRRTHHFFFDRITTPFPSAGTGPLHSKWHAVLWSLLRCVAVALRGGVGGVGGVGVHGVVCVSPNVHTFLDGVMSATVGFYQQNHCRTHHAIKKRVYVFKKPTDLSAETADYRHIGITATGAIFQGMLLESRYSYSYSYS